MANGKVYQTLTAIANAFGAFSMGLLFVWPSYTTPLFRAENTTLLHTPMTVADESLLGSLPSLGAMLGTAVAGPLIETYGRKLGGLAATLPFVLSWAIVAVAKSANLILAARFIGGISGGANLVFAPMFISEVAEDSIRGSLVSAIVMFYGLGTLFSYLLGWFLSYNVITWVNLVCGVIACGLLLVVAESPIYLLKKNRDDEARQSLAVYRGASPNSMIVQNEMTRLKQQINPAYEMVSINEKPDETEKEKLNGDTVIEPAPKKSALKTLFLNPSTRRGFCVVLTVISMQVVMGIVPVQVYAKQVFMQADPEKADLYSVIFAIVLVAGSAVAGGIADKAGRRVLIITSSAMVALCMASLGFLLQTRIAPPWVTVAMILSFCFCFMCGAGSIPYVLLAELFTPEVQAFASALIIEWVWFLNFLVLAVFNWLVSLLGIHGSFYLFSVNGVVNAVLCWWLVPETKGLASHQIQETLLKGRRK